jgi:hypothetical protein
MIERQAGLVRAYWCCYQRKFWATGPRPPRRASQIVAGMCANMIRRSSGGVVQNLGNVATVEDGGVLRSTRNSVIGGKPCLLSRD